MSEPKLCRDCRHARPRPLIVVLLLGHRWSEARCARVDTTCIEVNPVSGEPGRGEGRTYCSYQRTSFGDCGPEGKLFEPKQGRGA